VFGSIIGLGLATFGIITISKKQAAAAGEYKADEARYNREKRLDDILGNKDDE